MLRSYILRKSLYRRVVSGALAVAIALTSMPPPSAWAQPSSSLAAHTPSAAPLASASLDLSSLSIPETLGRIAQTWQPQDQPPRGFVIHLQDLHVHPDAQRHLSELIGYLHDQWGISLVAVEGASGLCDTALYSDFPDPPSTERIAKLFLKEGLFTGSEYYAITHPGTVSLWGVEDEAAYLEHLKAYQEGAARIAQTDAVLSRLRDGLLLRKRSFYPKPLLKLQALRAAYEQDDAGLQPYFDELRKQAKRDLSAYPHLDALAKAFALYQHIDMPHVKKESDQLLVRLKTQLTAAERERLSVVESRVSTREEPAERYYSTLAELAGAHGVPLGADRSALRTYLAYLTASEQIRSPALSDELDALEDAVEQALLTTDAQRTLARLLKDEALLDDLVHVKLSPRAFRDYQSRRASLTPDVFRRALAQLTPYALRTTQHAARSTHDEQPDLDRLFSALPAYEHFYDLALKRDEALARNTIKLLDERTTHDAPRTTILITGGFHTTGITERLKQQGIAYAVITPSSNGAMDDARYRARLNDEIPPLHELIEQLDRQTLVPPLATFSPSPSGEQPDDHRQPPNQGPVRREQTSPSARKHDETFARWVGAQAHELLAHVQGGYEKLQVWIGTHPHEVQLYGIALNGLVLSVMGTPVPLDASTGAVAATTLPASGDSTKRESPLPDVVSAELGCLAYEAARLKDFLDALKAQVGDRPIVVVENAGYGLVVLRPIRSVLAAERVPLVTADVSSWSMDMDPLGISADLFVKPWLPQLLPQQPVLVVVDASHSLSNQDAYSKDVIPHYPAAYYGYRNYIIALNEALGFAPSGTETARAFSMNDQELGKLRASSDYRALVEFLARRIKELGIRPTHPQPYRMAFWTPTATSLDVRSWQSQIRGSIPLVPPVVRPEEVLGPTLIITETAMTHEDLVAAEKAGDQRAAWALAHAGNHRHIPAFFDTVEEADGRRLTVVAESAHEFYQRMMLDAPGAKGEATTVTGEAPTQDIPQVPVTIPTPLRPFVEGQKAEVDVQGATLGDLLNNLAPPGSPLRPHLFVQQADGTERLRRTAHLYIGDEDVTEALAHPTGGEGTDNEGRPWTDAWRTHPLTPGQRVALVPSILGESGKKKSVPGAEVSGQTESGVDRHKRLLDEIATRYQDRKEVVDAVTKVRQATERLRPDELAFLVRWHSRQYDSLRSLLNLYAPNILILGDLDILVQSVDETMRIYHQGKRIPGTGLVLIRTDRRGHYLPKVSEDALREIHRGLEGIKRVDRDLYESILRHTIGIELRPSSRSRGALGGRNEMRPGLIWVSWPSPGSLLELQQVLIEENDHNAFVRQFTEEQLSVVDRIVFQFPRRQRVYGGRHDPYTYLAEAHAALTIIQFINRLPRPVAKHKDREGLGFIADALKNMQKQGLRAQEFRKANAILKVLESHRGEGVLTEQGEALVAQFRQTLEQLRTPGPKGEASTGTGARPGDGEGRAGEAPTHAVPQVPVAIPTPLRPFVEGKTVVDVYGATLGELLDHLAPPDSPLRPHLFVTQNDGTERLRRTAHLYIGDEDVTETLAHPTGGEGTDNEGRPWTDAWRTYPLHPGQRVALVPAIPGASGEEEAPRATMADRRIQRMCQLSQGTGEWEAVKPQWQIASLIFSPGGIQLAGLTAHGAPVTTDEFGNHPHWIFELANAQTGVHVYVGPDDVQHLFPERQEAIDTLRKAKEATLQQSRQKAERTLRLEQWVGLGQPADRAELTGLLESGKLGDHHFAAIDKAYQQAAAAWSHRNPDIVLERFFEVVDDLTSAPFRRLLHRRLNILTAEQQGRLRSLVSGLTEGRPLSRDECLALVDIHAVLLRHQQHAVLEAAAWARRQAQGVSPIHEPRTPAYHANLWIANWLATHLPADQRPLILDIGANLSVFFRIFPMVISEGNMGLAGGIIDLEPERDLYQLAPNPMRVRASIADLEPNGLPRVEEATDGTTRDLVSSEHHFQVAVASFVFDQLEPAQVRRALIALEHLLAQPPPVEFSETTRSQFPLLILTSPEHAPLAGPGFAKALETAGYTAIFVQSNITNTLTGEARARLQNELSAERLTILEDSISRPFHVAIYTKTRSVDTDVLQQLPDQLLKVRSGRPQSRRAGDRSRLPDASRLDAEQLALLNAAATLQPTDFQTSSQAIVSRAALQTDPAYAVFEDRLTALLWVSQHLSQRDRSRVSAVATQWDKHGAAFLAESDVQFILERPLEQTPRGGFRYKNALQAFPHLESQLKRERSRAYEQFRLSQLRLDPNAHRREGLRERFAREYETEVFSIDELYGFENTYREEHQRPTVFAETRDPLLSLHERRSLSTDVLESIFGAMLSGRRPTPKRMTSEYLRALQLAYLEGLSPSEIGVQLGITGVTENYARQLTFRGRQALITWLRPFGVSAADVEAALAAIKITSELTRQLADTHEQYHSFFDDWWLSYSQWVFDPIDSPPLTTIEFDRAHADRAAGVRHLFRKLHMPMPETEQGSLHPVTESDGGLVLEVRDVHDTVLHRYLVGYLASDGHGRRLEPILTGGPDDILIENQSRDAALVRLAFGYGLVDLLQTLQDVPVYRWGNVPIIQLDLGKEEGNGVSLRFQISLPKDYSTARIRPRVSFKDLEAGIPRIEWFDPAEAGTADQRPVAITMFGATVREPAATVWRSATDWELPEGRRTQVKILRDFLAGARDTAPPLGPLPVLSSSRENHQWIAKRVNLGQAIGISGSYQDLTVICKAILVSSEEGEQRLVGIWKSDANPARDPPMKVVEATTMLGGVRYWKTVQPGTSTLRFPQESLDPTEPHDKVTSTHAFMEEMQQAGIRSVSALTAIYRYRQDPVSQVFLDYFDRYKREGKRGSQERVLLVLTEVLNNLQVPPNTRVPIDHVVERVQQAMDRLRQKLNQSDFDEAATLFRRLEEAKQSGVEPPAAPGAKGDAITVTGAPLDPAQEIRVHALIRSDFEQGTARALTPEELAELDLDGLAKANGVTVFEIPSLAQANEFLVAHPGRGGEAYNHELRQLYCSPARLATIRGLTPAARRQFWAHEVGHITMANESAYANRAPPTEAEVQARYPIDLVLAELTPPADGAVGAMTSSSGSPESEQDLPEVVAPQDASAQQAMALGALHRAGLGASVVTQIQDRVWQTADGQYVVKMFGTLPDGYGRYQRERLYWERYAPDPAMVWSDDEAQVVILHNRLVGGVSTLTDRLVAASTTAERAALTANAARAMARLHRTTFDTFGWITPEGPRLAHEAHAIADHPAPPSASYFNYLLPTIKRRLDALQSAGYAPPSLEAFAAWQPAVDAQRQYRLNTADFNPWNIFVQADGQVTTIIDGEWIRAAPPERDVAVALVRLLDLAIETPSLMPSLNGMAGAFLEAYEAAAGRPINETLLSFYMAVDRLAAAWHEHQTVGNHPKVRWALSMARWYLARHHVDRARLFPLDRVAFEYGAPQGHRVGIRGLFTKWTETPLAYDETRHAYRATFSLPPGEQAYQLVVDGQAVQTTDGPNFVLMVEPTESDDVVHAALAQSLETVRRAGRRPLLSIDLDDTLLDYQAAAGDQTLQTLMNWLETGAVAINTRTQYGLLDQRLLQGLVQRLQREGRLSLMASLHAIVTTTDGSVEVYRGQPDGRLQQVAVLPQGSKADGLSRLLRELGPEVTVVAAFGDRFFEPWNDGSLLRHPAIPVLVNVGRAIREDALPPSQQLINAEHKGPDAVDAYVRWLTAQQYHGEAGQKPIKRKDAPALWSRGGNVPDGLQAAKAGAYLTEQAGSAITDSEQVVSAIRDAAAKAAPGQPFEVTVAGTTQRLIQREVEGGLRVIVPTDFTWEGEDGLGADIHAMLARLREEGHALDLAQPLVCLTGYFLTQHDTQLTRHLAGNHVGDGLIILDRTFQSLPQPLRITLLTHEGRHEATGQQGDEVEEQFAQLDAELLGILAREQGLSNEQLIDLLSFGGLNATPVRVSVEFREIVRSAIERLSVITTLAEVLAQPPDAVRIEVLGWGSERIHQAFVRLSNLQAPWFLERVQRWWGTTQHHREAMDLLVRGFTTRLPSGKRWFDLAFADLPEELSAGLPPSLDGKRLFKSNVESDEIELEWLYVPDRGIWLPVEVRHFLKGQPVGRPVAIRTALSDRNEELAIGANFSHQRLGALFDGHGPYALCFRVSPTGTAVVGSEFVSTRSGPFSINRQRGVYNFMYHRDHLTQSDIGNGGVARRFRFLDEQQPRALAVVTLRSRDPETLVVTSRAIESHNELVGETLNALTTEHGSFWIEVPATPQADSETQVALWIGSRPLRGTLTIDAPWIRQALGISVATEEQADRANAQPYAARISLGFQRLPVNTINVPPAVFMVGGAPAYLEIAGQPGEALKRLETETPQGVKQDAIDAAREHIHSDTLLTALAHAAQHGQRVVATRLKPRLSSGTGHTGYKGIDVARQTIYIPTELSKGLDGVSAAEVVYDPARVVVDPATQAATPIPVLVRLGHYQTDDPYEPAADDPRKPGLCQFTRVAEFPVSPDPSVQPANSRFIASRAPTELHERTTPGSPVAHERARETLDAAETAFQAGDLPRAAEQVAWAIAGRSDEHDLFRGLQDLAADDALDPGTHGEVARLLTRALDLRQRIAQAQAATPPAAPPAGQPAAGYPSRPILASGEIAAVRAVLSDPPRGVLYLTGPRGAGKTTLENILIGRQPDTFCHLYRTRPLRDGEPPQHEGHMLPPGEYAAGKADGRLIGEASSSGSSPSALAIEDLRTAATSGRVIVTESVLTVATIEQLWPAVKIQQIAVLPIEPTGALDAHSRQALLETLARRLRARKPAITDEALRHELGQAEERHEGAVAASNPFVVNPEGASSDAVYAQFEPLALHAVEVIDERSSAAPVLSAAEGPAAGQPAVFTAEEIAEIRARGTILRQVYPQLSLAAKRVLLSPTFLLVFMGVKPGCIQSLEWNEPDPMVLRRELEAIPGILGTLGISFSRGSAVSQYHLGQAILQSRDLLREHGLLLDGDQRSLEEVQALYTDGHWTPEGAQQVGTLLATVFARIQEDKIKGVVWNGVMMGYPEEAVRLTVQVERGEPTRAKRLTLFPGVYLIGDPESDATARYQTRVHAALYSAYSLIPHDEEFSTLARELGLPADVMARAPLASLIQPAGPPAAGAGEAPQLTETMPDLRDTSALDRWMRDLVRRSVAFRHESEGPATGTPVTHIAFQHGVTHNFTRHEQALTTLWEHAQSAGNELVIVSDNIGPVWNPQAFGGRWADEVEPDDPRLGPFFEGGMQRARQHLARAQGGEMHPEDGSFNGASLRWIARHRVRVLPEASTRERWFAHYQAEAMHARAGQLVQRTGSRQPADEARYLNLLDEAATRLAGNNTARERGLAEQLQGLQSPSRNLVLMLGANHPALSGTFAACGLRLERDRSSLPSAQARTTGFSELVNRLERGESVEPEERQRILLQEIPAAVLRGWAMQRVGPAVEPWPSLYATAIALRWNRQHVLELSEAIRTGSEMAYLTRWLAQYGTSDEQRFFGVEPLPSMSAATAAGPPAAPPEVPAPTVRAVIRDQDGRVLLLLKGGRSTSSQYGLWELPGGGVESGEQSTEAVAREVREETGLADLVLEEAGSLKEPIETVAGPRHVILFAARVQSPHAIQLDSVDGVHSAFQWVAASELSTLELTDATRLALLQVFAPAALVPSGAEEPAAGQPADVSGQGAGGEGQGTRRDPLTGEEYPPNRQRYARGKPRNLRPDVIKGQQGAAAQSPSAAPDASQAAAHSESSPSLEELFARDNPWRPGFVIRHAHAVIYDPRMSYSAQTWASQMQFLRGSLAGEGIGEAEFVRAMLAIERARRRIAFPAGEAPPTYPKFMEEEDVFMRVNPETGDFEVNIANSSFTAYLRLPDAENVLAAAMGHEYGYVAFRNGSIHLLSGVPEVAVPERVRRLMPASLLHIGRSEVVPDLFARALAGEAGYTRYLLTNAKGVAFRYVMLLESESDPDNPAGDPGQPDMYLVALNLLTYFQVLVESLPDTKETELGRSWFNLQLGLFIDVEGEDRRALKEYYAAVLRSYVLADGLIHEAEEPAATATGVIEGPVLSESGRVEGAVRSEREGQDDP